jgi:hypothetical protein
MQHMVPPPTETALIWTSVNSVEGFRVKQVCAEVSNCVKTSVDGRALRYLPVRQSVHSACLATAT